MADHIEFDVRILADGTASITTGKIPDEVHDQADDILHTIESVLGGESTVEQLRAGHGHAHDHDHAHEREQNPRAA